MTHIAIWSAVLAAAVWSVPASVCAQAVGNQSRNLSDVLMADAGSAPAGGAASNAATEPMVAPVKRVAPRTPVFTHGAASGATSGKKKSSAPIVPARPNCDPGFKVDVSGKGCTKVAGGDAPKSEGKKKNR